MRTRLSFLSESFGPLNGVPKLPRLCRRSFLQKALPASCLLARFPYFALPGPPMAAQDGMQHDANSRSQEKMAHPPLLTGEPQLNTRQLPIFVDPLPLPDVIRPVKGRLQVTMHEIETPVHRDLPPARVWTYAAGDGRHGAASSNPMSPLIELHKGHAAEIEWINLLPRQHLFAIDHSLHGCGRDIPDVRAVVHMHGARTEPGSDGYPEDWYVIGQSRVCHYPVEQEATTLWYHDHAMGLNRLNIYAGLAGMVLVRDEVERSLRLPTGSHEVPLVLYDRMLTRKGQLLYPTSGNPDHPWVSEFIGNALCVNGKLQPYFDVDPALYRFRVLNAANSRFFNLNLSGQMPFHLIGSDQGLLAAALSMTSLLVAPGERGDLLIDFSALAGQKLHLQTGVQPMLEFRVRPRAGSRAPRVSIPETLRPVPRSDPAIALRTRTITLNEYQDKVRNPVVMLLNRKHWHEPVTETVRLNTTEIWEFVNLTEDTHPMHLHLVRFQILDRRLFDPFDYLTLDKLRYKADADPPAPHELGWKDVVQCPPGMVTRIVVRFEGYIGRYLYHCHILEHEANDMMRPYDIVA
jgi:spore coat protein A, manganese oxidase